MLMGDSGWGLAMKKAPACDSKIRALGHEIPAQSPGWGGGPEAESKHRASGPSNCPE